MTTAAPQAAALLRAAAATPGPVGLVYVHALHVLAGPRGLVDLICALLREAPHPPDDPAAPPHLTQVLRTAATVHAAHPPGPGEPGPRPFLHAHAPLLPALAALAHRLCVPT